MNLTRKLMVKSGRTIRLKEIDPDQTPSVRDKSEAVKRLEKNHARLADLQYRLYAENRRALLIVLQAMDAGGKDGTIRHVMSGMNPQGCRVTSFKVPTPRELSHDFLWRIHLAVPPRGEIGIFNRSHYEDVLAVRVHELVPASVWKRRYAQINAFERMLTENDVRILKFFLHISKSEQKERLESRLKDPSKNWKLEPADIEERQHWGDYREAYEDVLCKCSTPWAPWFVIPANHKWYRNFAVSQIISETLAALRMRFPQPAFNPAKIRID